MYAVKLISTAWKDEGNMYAVKLISTAWKDEGNMYAVKLISTAWNFEGITDVYLTDKFTRFGRVQSVEFRNKKYRAYLDITISSGKFCCKIFRFATLNMSIK